MKDYIIGKIIIFLTYNKHATFYSIRRYLKSINVNLSRDCLLKRLKNMTRGDPTNN